MGLVSKPRPYTPPQAIAGCVAYVAQDTGFFSCLTVRETLLFTARLHDAAGADAEVDATLHRLGLDECVGRITLQLMGERVRVEEQPT